MTPVLESEGLASEDCVIWVDKNSVKRGECDAEWTMKRQELAHHKSGTKGLEKEMGEQVLNIPLEEYQVWPCGKHATACADGSQSVSSWVVALVAEIQSIPRRTSAVKL